MRKKGVVGPLLFLLICVGATVGWVMNVVKLVGCDFAEPWKEEILRGIGLFVAPLGCIFGWLNF